MKKMHIEFENWFRQICAGVHHLHTHKIQHLDLHSENILISKHDNTVKIIDLDSAVFFEDLETTSDYMGAAFDIPLEVESGQKGHPHPTTDIWALGILAYFMLERKKPKRESNNVRNVKLTRPNFEKWETLSNMFVLYDSMIFSCSSIILFFQYK